MKNLFIALCLVFAGHTYAQYNILNVKKADQLGQQQDTLTEQTADEAKDKPLEYGYVDNRDILWAKTTWEYIDLDERINFPLLYPIDEGRVGSERQSLFQVLLKNIENGKIPAIYGDSYFNRKRTLEDLGPTLSRRDTLPQGYEQLNAGEELDPQFIRRTDVDGSDIKGYKIRGLWYFDNRQGELRYRILGIAPVVVDAYAKSNDNVNAQPVDLFWVFYPEAREVLYEAKAFNPKNTAQPVSFDHLLNSRHFNAVIYKEDNAQGDREVKDYIHDNSLMQLLESRRIKESIRNFESDMWNY